MSALEKRKPRKDDKPLVTSTGGLNPYEVLGVPRNALPLQIKMAFRNKAKECHPDLGGDAKEFEDLKLCYDVLSDPEKRAEYDRTGQLKKTEPNNVLPDAYNRIGIVFQTVLAELKGRNAIPEQCDLIRLMTTNFREGIARRIDERKQLQDNIPLWDAFRGRFSAKKGRNYLSDLVASTITQMQEQLKTLDRWDAADKMALTMLDDYEFRFDRPVPQRAAFAFVPQTDGFNTGTRW